MTRSKVYLIELIGTTVFAFGPVFGYGAEKIVIKATSVQMPSQILGEALAQMKSKIEAKLPGRVEVRTYPSAQLYTQTEEVAALSRGEIQMAAAIGTGSLPVLSPVFQVLELPGLFESRDIFFKVLRGPVGQELWKEAEKKNIKVLSFWNVGKKQICNSRGIEIKLPKDTVGLKIRPAGKSYALMLEAWGGMGINTAPEEQFNALQQGIIDGILTSTRIIYDRKLYENLTNLTDLGQINFSCLNILANKKWWDSLPTDVQSLITEAIAEVTQMKMEEVDREDEEAYRGIAAAKTKVYKIPEKDYKIWMESSRKIWPKLTEKIGQDWVNKIARAAENAK